MHISIRTHIIIYIHKWGYGKDIRIWFLLFLYDVDMTMKYTIWLLDSKVRTRSSHQNYHTRLCCYNCDIIGHAFYSCLYKFGILNDICAQKTHHFRHKRNQLIKSRKCKSAPTFTQKTSVNYVKKLVKAIWVKKKDLSPRIKCSIVFTTSKAIEKYSK